MAPLLALLGLLCFASPEPAPLPSAPSLVWSPENLFEGWRYIAVLLDKQPGHDEYTLFINPTSITQHGEWIGPSTTPGWSVREEFWDLEVSRTSGEKKFGISAFTSVRKFLIPIHDMTIHKPSGLQRIFFFTNGNSGYRIELYEALPTK